ncbi:uncharacterized protein HD556DRAFT_1312778 [Suillus plorans]|uniref:Uncharacterized protein n=1 Tax=Suillus plorans TaxID=116603 RepID=A0A9P7DCX2_9AGAM|nr:uncharacterized protein HD556DRAFT_1312778 [Suillus plorans]KAG1787314.1 hypothetical protein HD556DRAFT_1312778 [Suillus plorans]
MHSDPALITLPLQDPSSSYHIPALLYKQVDFEASSTRPNWVFFQHNLPILPADDIKPLKRAHFILPQLVTVYPISSVNPPSTPTLKDEKRAIEEREAERRKRVVRGNSISPNETEEWWNLEKVESFYRECCASREEESDPAISAAFKGLPPPRHPSSMPPQTTYTPYVPRARRGVAAAQPLPLSAYRCSPCISNGIGTGAATMYIILRPSFNFHCLSLLRLH